MTPHWLAGLRIEPPTSLAWAAGTIPEATYDRNGLPFNLQKSETLVWLFTDVPYHEEKVRREYVGASQGVSIRVMKGVYYRVGGFKGRPVETAQIEKIDEGLLGITTKHVYFKGARKSFRIPYSKIVSWDPYDDGIGLMRDARSARPQIFITGDGWFTYNLVTNLAQM